MADLGRPSTYSSIYAEKAYKLCLLGATDAEMADIFGIHEATLHRWKQDHPEFCESIRRGKADADANVAERLYQRAMGYEHESVKIFQYEGSPVVVPYTERYPPDTQAASLWLRNRQPQKWRDKQDIENRTTLNVSDPLAALLGEIAAAGTKVYDPKSE